MNILDFLVSLLIFLVMVGSFFMVVRTGLACLPEPNRPIYRFAYAIVAFILLLLFLSEIGWIGAPRGWRTWTTTKVTRQ